MYDFIVVGSGFAGATIAEQQAKKGKKVLVIDSRDHIGGNSYDYYKEGILIHKYGPHIFHTFSKEAFDYLSNFTSWYPYEHRVLGHVLGNVVPIPFNLTSIRECFETEKAERIIEVLLAEYKGHSKVTITQLLENNNEEIKDLANYVFENVFKHYTMKQWGLSADEIDPKVIARVPVNLSLDDRYFSDAYQCMPKEGYTKIFERMLSSDNIDIKLNTEMREILEFRNGTIYYEGQKYNGKVIYTGQIDELFNCKLGALPYRSLDIRLDKKAGQFQTVSTENYPGPKDEFPFTRITEYRHFMEEFSGDYSYIHTEYPVAYDKKSALGNIPYYPIFTDENQKKYEKYLELSKEYKSLYLVGRLAEYRYYNMDQIVLRALNVSKGL